jgi:hypothetical protein
MMKEIAFLLIFLCPSILSAQQTETWLQMLENPEAPIYKLRPENVAGQYLKYDFSTLLLPQTPFLGYIGKDFQKLSIFFTSINKSARDPSLYIVSGISLMGKDKYGFKGSISIQQIREFASLHYGLDNIFKNSGIRAQGALIGRYRLEGPRGQTHSGVFEGIMTLYWVIDRNGIIHSDHIEWYSDSYKNNQYVGTWTEYGKNMAIVANWGEYRIPFSTGLDIGAAEFHPSPKYKDKGWGEPALP